MGTRSGLEQLRFLTQRLQCDAAGDSLNTLSSNLVSHHILRGICLSWDVFLCPELGCIRCFISGGTATPFHQHKSREWLLPYRGELIVHTREQPEKLLPRGEVIIIEPEIVHSVVCEADCWFLAVLVPHTPDWPM